MSTPASTVPLPCQSRIDWRMAAPFAVWIILFLIPAPEGLKANQWHYFAIFAAVIAGLVLESMPACAVGLIGLTAAALGGCVQSDPGNALNGALSGFSDSTVRLIVGAFIFAIGYRNRQAHARPRAVALADLALAPATPSNTARSGGTIYPIISNIPKLYGSEPGPTAGRIGTYVLWTAFAVTGVTSSLFMTALAPNVAALAIAKKTTGVEIDWTQWFVGFAPLGIVLLLVVPLLSYLLCKPEISQHDRDEEAHALRAYPPEFNAVGA